MVKKVRRHRQRLISLSPDRAIDIINECLRASWPTEEIRANLEYRRAVYERCQLDANEQEKENEKCSKDCRYWIETWAWTFDPRLSEGKFRPFLLFPVQVDYIDWLNLRYKNQEDGIVEKSRDMGFSWLSVAWATWKFLFEDGFTCVFGSNLIRNVDTLGNHKSLFEKIRMILRALPVWMLPKGFSKRAHLNTKLRIINPERNGIITGEGGHNIGRSDRASIVFIDEAAHVERAEEVEQALSQTTDCRIWGSTPKGSGNLFYTKVKSDQFPVFRFHWQQDPRKNRWILRNPDGSVFAEGHGECSAPAGMVPFYPWYEDAKKRFTPLTVAQEIDIDYAGSIDDVVFPSHWVQACVTISLTPGDYREAGLDVGGSGSDGAESVYTLVAMPVALKIKRWSGLSPVKTARRAIRYAREDQVHSFKWDHTGVGEGVSGEIQDSATAEDVTFKMQMVKWGGKPSKRMWPSGRRSNQMFMSAKAEDHWILRERMRKTYEHVLFLQGHPEGVEHPLDELLSIPKDNKLISQLSTIRFEERDNGKITIESKLKMKKRNVASPDIAESLIIACSPDHPELEVTGSHSEEVYA